MYLPLHLSPFTFTAASLLWISAVVSCANRANDCDAAGTCEATAGADGGGGRRASGGNATAGENAGGQTQGGRGVGGDVHGGAGALGSGVSGGGLGGATTSGTTRAPCDGLCVESKPVCDIEADQCVECLLDVDCRTSSVPVCSPERRCVECNTSEACGTDPTRGICAANRCVQCVRTSDCSHDEKHPVCDPSTNTCVGCMENADCKAAGAHLCNPDTHLCVGCLAKKDCTAPTASTCDATKNTCAPCVTDEDCSHVTGKGVCDLGTCVECTGRKPQACGALGGVALVCNSLTRTCSKDQRIHSSGLCQPCISDLQCREGQLCSAQSYKGKLVGHFCFWRQGEIDAGAPSDCALESNRPYVNLQSDAVSIDGESADLCTLRSVTTCKAIHQYSAVDCAPNGNAEPRLCGIAAGQDALCVPFGATQFRCTNACLSADDCVGGGTASSITCDTGTTPRVCTLN